MDKMKERGIYLVVSRWPVCIDRPGVLKDPRIMSGVWLVIFYVVCLILARQVCG